MGSGPKLLNKPILFSAGVAHIVSPYLSKHSIVPKFVSSALWVLLYWEGGAQHYDTSRKKLATPAKIYKRGVIDKWPTQKRKVRVYL